MLGAGVWIVGVMLNHKSDIRSVFRLDCELLCWYLHNIVLGAVDIILI